MMLIKNECIHFRREYNIHSCVFPLNHDFHIYARTRIVSAIKSCFLVGRTSAENKELHFVRFTGCVVLVSAGIRTTLKRLAS